MGRLRTLTILLAVGASGAATDGATPDAPPSAPSAEARPPSPVAPVKYLEAGARLFNSGQYDLAAKYITAAQSYRDKLSPSEQTVLDAYLREMAKAPQTASASSPSPAPAPAPAPVPVPAAPQATEVATAPAVVPAAAPAAPAVMPTQTAAVDAGVPAPAPAPAANAGDLKQSARWLLQAAREQIRQGNYDDAAAKIEQVRGMNVNWGLFDDTPAKVAEVLEKARPKTAVAAVEPGAKHDRGTARAKLKEARAAIAAKNFEAAEAIATDVKGWGLTYGLFEDNPDKVAAAARALRRRDTIRNTSPREAPSQGVYDVLVQEARQLMTAGQLDEAEAKAKQAQSMNVVPSLTADRADAVLHDLAMARARTAPKSDGSVAVAAAEPPAGDAAQAVAPLAVPAAEPASVKLEHEANELLAKGDSKAASAKFAEAETQRLKESGQISAHDDPVMLDVPETGTPPAPAPVAALPDAPPIDEPAAILPVSTGRGEQLLNEAAALFKSGNLPAAKAKVEEARAGKLGVDSRANDLLAQIVLAEQGGALSLYESALEAIRNNKVDRARSLLTEVLAAGEGLDDGMRQKVQGLLDKLPKEKDQAGKAVVGDRLGADDAEALAAQKLNAEVGTKLAEARRLQETDPDKAIGIYEQTLKGVKAAGLSETMTRPMVRRLEVALELARKDKVAFDVKMKDKAFRAEIEQKRLRILEADKAKKGRLKELMDKATAAMADGKYVEAEAFAKRAQEVDPNEVAATIIAWKARAERRFKRDVELRSQKDEGAVTAFQEVDLASVANPEVQLRGIEYARNFKDLTKERLRMNAKLEVKKNPKDLAIQAKLRDSVSLNMDKQPLGDAITFLANYTGLNIVLDPKALNDENVTSGSPVTLTANNIKLETALKLMLRPLGLTYKVEDEVLMITSPSASLAQTRTETYYVGDLVMPPAQTPNIPGVPTPPSVDEARALQQQVQQGNTLNVPAGLDGVGQIKGERPRVDMTPLVELITSSIAPGTWRVTDTENGGGNAAYGMGGGFGGAEAGDTQPIGSITPFYLSISLIIRHTAEIHDQVADLLRQLRRLQDLQVSIEVRFITVSDNFFEQIGVNFDFNIQSDVVGKHNTFAAPNPAAALFGIPGGGIGGGTGGTGGIGGGTGGIGGGTGGIGGGGIGGGGIGGGGIGGGGIGGGTGGIGGGTGGIGGGTGGGGASSLGGAIPYITNPFRDHSLGNRLPVTVGLQAGGVGNFSPDLNIPFTNTLASLITPTNAIPGAGATFGIAFLSDLEVYFFLTAAQGDTRTNILQAPKVTTFNGAPAILFNSNVINFVSSLIPIIGPGSVAFQPSVQSFPDGVMLSVTPVVSADRRYVRMTLSPTFQAIEGFDTISVPAAVGGAGLGGGSAAINGTIQLPRFTSTIVSTTVTVPDGGTVLLGGVKRMNEERREFGVPILAKTPWINRLFRNVGIGRVTSSIMMMVTPRIIILEEEEEKLGIPSVAF